MAESSLSIVIPAFNEKARISHSLQALTQWLKSQDETTHRAIEVLYVDDGSTDNTAAVIDEFRAIEPRIHRITLPQNRGKGAAVRTGMLQAKHSRILFSDADFATPLTELPKLDQALDQGADIAIGSRGLPDSNIAIRQHPAREALGRTFNMFVRVSSGLAFKDTQCGFKLFTGESAQWLFSRSRVDRYAFDVEILMLAKGRFRIDEIPVVWRHVENSKVSTLRDGTKMVRDLTQLRVKVALRRLFER